MQRKVEKGDLGKVLSCMRLALCNESIADMANNLGISPTYLNSIECDIRPCTFKILEGIFIHYVELAEIKNLDIDVFSPQNVFNSAWNAGLHTTLGIPLSASQTFKFLMDRIKKDKANFEEEKTAWLQKVSDDVDKFNDVPAKYFIDEVFVEDLQQAVRFALLQKANSIETHDEAEKQKVEDIFAKLQKKTTKSIAKCGNYLKLAKVNASKLSPVEVVDARPNSY